MNDPAVDTRKKVGQWVNQLAEMTRHGAAPVVVAQIDSVVDMLMIDRFPSAAFTKRSLRHVAQDARFFPSYAEIKAALTGWWEANRPRLSVPLDQQDVTHLSPMDQAWVNFYHVRRAEILDPDYAPRRGSVAADLANLASLVRQHAYPAWAHVSGAPKDFSVSHPDLQTQVKVAALVAEATEVLGQAVESKQPAPFQDLGRVRPDHLNKMRQARLSQSVNMSRPVDLNGG